MNGAGEAVIARPAAPLRPHAKPRVRLSGGTSVLLGLLVLVYVWRLQDLFPVLGSLQLPILVTGAALAWFIGTGRHSRLRQLIKSPPTRNATWLLLLMVVGIPTSIFQGMSFSFLVQDHGRTFVAMTVVALSLRTFRDVERSILVHVIGATVFAWLAFTKFEVSSDGRLVGVPYYDANDLGMLLVMVLPLAVHFSARVPGRAIWTRMAMLPVVVLCILAVVKTGSRGAFLGLIAVALAMLAGYRVVPLRTRIAVLACGALLLVVFGSESYWTLMKSLLNPTADYNWAGGSETGRMEIWKRGVGYMLANPVLGVGVRCFSIAEGTLAPQAALQELGFGFKWSTAHNSFVQIGAEMGLTGLLLFLLMLHSAFKVLWSVPKPRRRANTEDWVRASLAQALAASMVGFVVTGFFLSMAYGAVLYFFIAQIAALGMVLKDERRTKRL